MFDFSHFTWKGLLEVVIPALLSYLGGYYHGNKP